MSLDRSTVLSLPIPPTLNHAIGYQGKRRYLSAEYKAFLWSVAEKWGKVRSASWQTDARFGVAIRFYFPDRRKRDLDNRVKPLLDALTRVGVWKDDSLVDLLLVLREKNDKNDPRAEVWIRPLKNRDSLLSLFNLYQRLSQG